MSPSLSNRQRLLDANMRLGTRVAAQIKTRVSKPSKEFERYRDEVFIRSLEGARPCKREELDAAISRTRVLFFGDYHSDYYSKKHVLDVFINLVRSGRKVVFATELVHIDEQPLLDIFLKGEIRERVLRKSLKEGQGGFWVDRWYMWSDLLQFVKKAGVPVYGVNSDPKNGDSLKKRDTNAARIIHDLTVANPDALICVLIGDLHLGPTHLPADLQTLFNGSSQPSTIVLQNLGPIYRGLIASGSEQQTEVVRIDENTFCAMYCTPIFRDLSHVFDTWIIDERENRLGRSNDEHITNCAAAFFELITHSLNEFLGIRIPKPQSDLLFAGFGSNGKKEFVRVVDSHTSPGPFKDFLLGELSLNHPCIFPDNELFVFVPTLNIRDITEGLGPYAHYSRLKDRKTGLFLTNPMERFYDEVLQRAIGYVFSKIISHYRKCLTPDDCRKILEQENPFLQPYETSRASLFLKYSEQEHRVLSNASHGVLDFFNLAPIQRFQLTRCIGYCLGERIFAGLIRGDLSISELKGLIGYDPRRQSTVELYSALKERFLAP